MTGILDNRGTLHFEGDVRAETLGRIMGPDLFGQFLTVVEVTHDEVTGVTTARLLPTRQDDLDNLDPSGSRTTRLDP